MPDSPREQVNLQSTPAAVDAQDRFEPDPPYFPWLARLSEIGVPPKMEAAEAKHVRFCNLASVAGGLCALLFFVLSLPVITDWGQTTPVEWVVIAITGLGSLLLFVPIALNHFGSRAAARLFFMIVSIEHVIALGTFFGSAAPVHLFLIVIAAMAMALFPDRERRRLGAIIALCAAAFASLLWLRARNVPVIDVHRPEIRLVMEVTISAGALLFAIVITRLLRDTTRRAELQAQREQDRADRLLLNILPEQIASRLKVGPGTIADGFQEVTVLFADLVGFTPMSRHLTPLQTLNMVNDIFSRFDALIDAFGLEKIKTIGDAYMLAGGLPTPIRSHAHDVARMALAMREEIKRVPGPGGSPLRLRIGIASGPVMAGVIGRKKFLYDLWGDTVNIASRMESSGEPDRIQVNRVTWSLLRDQFRFDERGSIEIKGQGLVPTWFLEGELESTNESRA